MACIFDQEYRDSILQNCMEICLPNNVINVEGWYSFSKITLYNYKFAKYYILSLSFVNVHLGNLFGTLQLRA